MKKLDYKFYTYIGHSDNFRFSQKTSYLVYNVNGAFIVKDSYGEIYSIKLSELEKNFEKVDYSND